MSAEPHELPVLVVGAGPVGLGAALLLARFGVRCRIVERRGERDGHPKARGIRLRTMELFRQWDIEDELRRAALPADTLRFIYCDSLAGAEAGRTPELEGANVPESPTTMLRVSQDVVERTLLSRVREAGVDLRFSTELLSLDQDDDGVTATVREPGGDRRSFLAQYVIAADGVGSRVRRELGIQMEGPPVLAYWQSIYWRGDISDLVRDRMCIQFFTGAATGSFVTVASVDGHQRWVSLVSLPPTAERPDPPSAAESVEIVRRAVGRPTLDVEVVDATTWRLSAQVAARFRAGRVLLAGDAAHSLPPTGGFGMNTGMQDVHNLVWKLVLVLGGRAPAGLLDTYEAERAPVARDNADWSVSNSKRIAEIRAALVNRDRGRLDAALRDEKGHVNAIGQDLGFHYDSGALVHDGTPAPPHDPATYRPAARPGHRAPHAWLRRGDLRVSTLDLFDRDFALLCGPGGGAWAAASAAAAADTGVHIIAHRIGADGELVSEDGRFPDLYGIGDDGAVLVRPDGHVAWRTPHAPAEPGRALADALQEALGLRSPARRSGRS